MVNRVREVTGKPVGFKAVIGESLWLRALLEEINLQGAEFAPDFITIDSADGGTGAAPQPLMDYVGLPLKESFPSHLCRQINHAIESCLGACYGGRCGKLSKGVYVCLGLYSSNAV